MPTSEKLIQLETRRQVVLERLKAGEVRKFDALLLALARRVRDRLARGDLTEYSVKRQEALIEAIRNMMTEGIGDATQQLYKAAIDIGKDEAVFEFDAVSAVVTATVAAPTATQAVAAIRTNPLAARGMGEGQLLEPWLKGWSKAQADRVADIVRLGFFEGETTQGIVRRVIGVISNNYQDGQFAAIQRVAETITRTAVQHAAMQARAESLKQMGVDRYEWVSTLDYRTSPQCQNLDGQVFEFGKGPLPPIHAGCRSAVTGVLPSKWDILKSDATRASADGPVDASLSYYEWLKTQPAAMQDLALGKSWGKVFRDGGLSAEKFGKLRLSKTFEPMTLEEAKAANPIVFDKVGL